MMKTVQDEPLVWDPVATGKNIAARRLAMPYRPSQRDMAKSMGISITTYYRLETGQAKNIRLNLFLLVAWSLGADPHELLVLKNPDQPALCVEVLAKQKRQTEEEKRLRARLREKRRRIAVDEKKRKASIEQLELEIERIRKERLGEEEPAYATQT
jgi:transcriptional regulator with XRE-family HTH domain